MLKSDNIKKKRGRPKKEMSPRASRDDDDFDFKPPLSRLIKRKNLEAFEEFPESNDLEQVKAEKKPENTLEAFGDFKISKKSKTQKSLEETKTAIEKDNNSKNSGKNKIRHSLEEMKIHKIFTEILNMAYQEEDTLMIISNILSAGRKALSEKTLNIKKKKNILLGSNLSQQEYMKKEKEIERAENEEIREVKEDIFNKLCASKITGFETKEMILSNLRKNYKRLTEDQTEGAIHEEEIEFDIKESEFEKLKTDQITLIEKLLNEEMFVINDLKGSYNARDSRGGHKHLQPNHLNSYWSNGPQNIPHGPHIINNNLSFSAPSHSLTQNNGIHEEGNKAESKMPSIAENEVYPGPQESFHIESRGNKLQLCRFMEEGEICNKSLSNILDGALNNKETFLKINENDVFQLKKHERAALLDMKSDQFYTEESFQRRQKEKYTQILKRIQKSENLAADTIPQTTLDELTELTAYVLNNVHYYQKFRIDEGLISPYDLIYVLEKIKN